MDCCKFTGNLPKTDCGMKKGGLRGSIYAANICEIASYTKTGKTVSAITMEVDPLTSNAYLWYQIDFKQDTAGFKNEFAIGNNTFVNQSLSMSVEGLTAASLETLEQLATAEVVFIVTDNQGKNHLLGRLDGLMLSEGVIGAGMAEDDFVGSVLTFTGGETEVSNFVTSGTTIEVSDGLGASVVVTLP